MVGLRAADRIGEYESIRSLGHNISYQYLQEDKEYTFVDLNCLVRNKLITLELIDKND
ncbi:unnamed protein product [Sphenostylis stenocarpa]|uniref:Uncharacterized protein n=1 Tax=Sphenostylis stenocarpa TaxID=92480 RepID=A0AA87B9V3_9FABA|nr:unnamed protein product [Sphenostylis stenocarpa]